MSITHILSATTPDDPAYEIRPSHWNSEHAQQITIVGNTAGASTISGTNIVYSAGPNVTLSVNGGSLVWSGGAGAAGNTGYLSAGTTYASLGTVSFSNLNGLAFGVDGQTITGSYTVPTQTNQTVGGYFVGNTTGQSSSSTVDARSVSIDGAGIVSAGWSNGSIRISATQSNQAFSADASSTFQTLTFQDSNGVSFSNNAGALRVTHALQYTSATSAITSNAMHSTSRPAFSADASSTFQTLTLQNSNGISFSNNAGAVRITHDLAFSSQTNNTGRIYVTAQSTGQSSSSTYDLRTLSIVPDGIVSAGWSNGSFRISATVAAQTNQTLGIYASSNTTGASSSSTHDARSLTIVGSDNISIGWTNGSLAIKGAAGGAGGSQSVGMSTQTAGGATAGTTGYASGSAILYHLVPGSNITMSQSVNGASGTMSIYAPSPGAAAEANWFTLAGDNTAGNTTASGSSLMLSVQGALTISGTNNSQIKISAPATSSLVGTNGVSISTNGSTISAMLLTASGYNPYPDREWVTGQQGQGTLQFDPERFPNVQFDRVMLPIVNTNSSNSSGSHTLSFWVGLYTRNVSTLSLQASASRTIAVTHSGTAGSYSLYSGIRLASVGMTTTLSGGEYWVGLLSRTTSGGANGSYSNMLLSNAASNFLGHFGSSHDTTYQATLGRGVYTATTSSMPDSVAFSQILGSNSMAFRPWLVNFASSTV